MYFLLSISCIDIFQYPVEMSPETIIINFIGKYGKFIQIDFIPVTMANPGIHNLKVEACAEPLTTTLPFTSGLSTLPSLTTESTTFTPTSLTPSITLLSTSAESIGSPFESVERLPTSAPSSAISSVGSVEESSSGRVSSISSQSALISSILPLSLSSSSSLPLFFTSGSKLVTTSRPTQASPVSTEVSSIPREYLRNKFWSNEH